METILSVYFDFKMSKEISGNVTRKRTKSIFLGLPQSLPFPFLA